MTRRRRRRRNPAPRGGAWGAVGQTAIGAVGALALAAVARGAPRLERLLEEDDGRAASFREDERLATRMAVVGAIEAVAGAAVAWFAPQYRALAIGVTAGGGIVAVDQYVSARGYDRAAKMLGG